MKYVKLPNRSYKSDDIEKFEQAAESTEEWQRHAKNDIKPEYLDTYTCIPLLKLEGCTFHATSYVDEEEQAYEDGIIRSTLITTADGQQFVTSWSISEFVAQMVKWNLIDASFQKEVV